MAAAVDHDSKRREVARIAAALIASEGLEGATIRRVAGAAGYSTTVVTHYFATKRDMLLAAYRHVAQEAQARFDAIAARQPVDLVTCLETILPLDAQSHAAWRVYFQFWPMASHDPAFTSEQIWWNRNALDLVAGLVGRGDADGNSAEVKDAQNRAQFILSALQGIALQAIFDPESWPAERQRKMLQDHVALILGPLHGKGGAD